MDPDELAVLVCGGRDFNDARTVGLVLGVIHQWHEIDVIIHGGCSGADRLAGKWAESNGVPVLEIPADWNKFGPAAGPIRNQRMLDDSSPDLVVAFPGGRGTADMVRRATNSHALVIRVPE